MTLSFLSQETLGKALLSPSSVSSPVKWGGKSIYYFIELLSVTVPQHVASRIYVLATVTKDGILGASVVVKNPPANAGDMGEVWSLFQEDPTCHGSTKSIPHNYWACALELGSLNYWAHMLQLLKPECLEPVLRNKRSHHRAAPAPRSWRRPVHSNEDSAQPKRNEENDFRN